MAAITFSPQARLDLLDIVEYLTAVAGARVARKYDTQIRRAIAALRDFPGFGAPRVDLGDETRIIVVDPYIVFYDGGPESQKILILRILHGHRDITQKLIARGRRDPS